MSIWHTLETAANKLDALHETQLADLRAERDGARGQVNDLSIMLSAARAESEARRIALDTVTAERDALAARARECEANHGGEDPDPDPEPPTPSGIRDLVRVRCFPHYGGKNYGQHDRVIGLLEDLGCGVSGLLTPGMSSSVVDFYRRVYETVGVKTWFTVGQPRKPLTAAQWDELEGILSGPLEGMVDVCSGWNEPNHVRGGGSLPANWAQQTAAHQAELWQRTRGLDIRVGTPQLWSGNMSTHDRDLKALAPLIAGSYDTTAWHLYPRGGLGQHWFDRFTNVYTQTLGDHPVVCTEAGYFTGDASGTGANPVTEQEQADLWPQHIRLYTDKGWGVSVFELLDDPAGGREGSLGIVRADWTLKPAFHTIKELLAA